MNILMLVKNSEVGGVLSCVKSLSEGLRETGDHVVIASCAGEGVKTMLSKENVKIIDFSAKSPGQIIKNYREIKKLVQEEKINVIHAQNRIPALYASVYCFFHKKVRYIWSNHLVPLPDSFFYRLTTRYGKFAVAEGIAGKEFLINVFKIPQNKVRIVNLGVHLEDYHKTPEQQQIKLKQNLGITKDQKVILLFGRLMPVKGHLFLLDALAKLSADQRKNLKVIFPGENAEYQKEIDEYAKRLDLDEVIIYPGYVNSQEYLSISDLMILPSKQEGFGIVNVEAFAMGIPVIRTKTAGYLDMEDCCLGVEYGDTQTLSKYIGYMWTEPEKLYETAQTAFENVERFSVKRMTAQYREIYQECLNEK